MSPMRWYGDEAIAHIEGKVAPRIERAARGLRDHIRKGLSVPNAVMLSGIRGRRSRVLSGSRGSQPSRAGEYPRKVTGHLRRNVQMEMDRRRLVARVGTNVLYGKFLELGTRNELGTPKMKRRPWLTRGLREFRSRMRAIIEGGS